MMFRSAQAEDDSGSDWDEQTPTVTPRSTTRQDPNAPHPPGLLNTPMETEQSGPSPSHGHKQHRPHSSHSHHTTHEAHATHIHSPHPPPTSHRSQQERSVLNGASNQIPSRHRQQGHNPKRHYPQTVHTSTSHTPPNQVTYSLQDIPQVAEGALRPPHILPPIDQSQSGTVAMAHDPPPLTPANINPVFEEQLVVNNAAPDHRYDDTTQLIPHENSGVLEFATVSGDSAGQLLPAQSPPPYSYMGGIAERSERMSKRCTEEVVSCMRIVSDFIINFTLGLLHFLCYHISRKLFCGALHILSDTITKPLIDLCFNELLWPISACLYQLSKALKLILTPIVELVGLLLDHIANIFRAFRLVDLHFNNTQTKPINV